MKSALFETPIIRDFISILSKTNREINGYVLSDKVGFIVSEDLSNITLTFGVFSFFMINVLCILILVFTNLIKMCLTKLKSS